MNPVIQAIAEACRALVTEGEELLSAVEKNGWPDTRPGHTDEHIEDTMYTLDNLLADRGEVRIPATTRIPVALPPQFERWFAGCLGLISANMASRCPEFVKMCEPAQEILSSDYMTFEEQLALARCIRRANAIVGSVPRYLEERLRDIRLGIAAQYVDGELDEADRLNEVGHVRAAGALAGALLERHLKLMCEQHEPAVTYDKRDGISKLNDKLKAVEAYDMVRWRRIQWMGDIRNNCDHAGTSEPRKEDVSDLIAGVRKFVTLQ